MVNIKSLEQSSFAVTSQKGKFYSAIPSYSISDDVQKDYKTDLKVFRKWCQYLSEATAIGKSIVQNFPVLVIGAGINLKPSLKIGTDRKKTKEAQKAISDLWETFVETAHIDGQTDLSSLLRSIVAAVVRDGDCLLYITSNDNGEIKLDVIEGSRIETPPESKFADKQKKPDIRLGVEVKNRTIKGYWVRNSFGNKVDHTFFPAFDKDGKILSFLVKNPNNTDRLNGYRGVPVMAAAVGAIDQLTKFKETELQASIISRKTVGTIETSSPTDVQKDMSDEVLGKIGTTKLGEIEFLIMQAGDKVNFHNGQDISNPNLDKVVKIYLEEIASVLNCPMQVIFSQLEDSSYSTNQTIKLQAWENTKIWRDNFIKNIIKPIYRLMLNKWIFEGRIPHVSEYSSDAAQVVISEKPNIAIKTKDVYEAQKIAKDNGIKSLQQICLENGDDAFEILQDQIDLEAEREELEQTKKITSVNELDLKKNEQIFLILDKVASGLYSKDQAKNFLIDMFNFSEEKADAYLGLKMAA